MEEEFYAAIKLVSGEEIFSLISKDDNDGDPVLILQSPIIINLINTHRGSMVKIKPWMEIPQDEIYFIKPDKVITITEVTNDMIIEMYNDYINSEDESEEESSYMPNRKNTGQVKPSKKMGYISSVEDARKSLEKIYKQDIKES